MDEKGRREKEDEGERIERKRESEGSSVDVCTRLTAAAAVPISVANNDALIVSLCAATCTSAEVAALSQRQQSAGREQPVDIFTCPGRHRREPQLS